MRQRGQGQSPLSRIVARRTLDAVRDEKIEKRLDLLLRIICRISKNTRINPAFYSVVANDHNAIYHGMNEIVVQEEPPDCLNELPAAVSHQPSSLCIPTWMPAQNPTLERIGQL